MPDNKVVYCRKAETGDLNAIVKIHRESMPNDVFANMGTQFLYDFYSGLLSHENHVLVTAKLGDIVQGFCLISDRPGSAMKLLSLRTVFRAIRILVTKPRLLLSALRQYIQLGKAERPDSAEIAFIAVSADCRGRGIGRSLIEHVCGLCRERGSRYLSTKTSNQRLARFYREVFDARVVESFKIIGQTYSILEWNL